MKVTLLQKLFEKYLMAARADETKLVPAIVKDPNSIIHGVSMVVCYERDDGLTPLFKLLSADEIQAMTPKELASEKLGKLFAEAAVDDKRSHPDEFGGTGSNPLFDWDAIDELDLDELR